MKAGWLIFSVIVFAAPVISADDKLMGQAPSSSRSCARPTVYYKPTINPSASCASRVNLTIVGGPGRKVISVCSKDAANLRMQGSGWISDSRTGEQYVVNFVNMTTFLRLSSSEAKRCPFGYGVRQICLDPFASVAADLSCHKPGDVLYFPKLVGMPIPKQYQVGGKTTHDGYVIVRDTGPKSHIKGCHRFDFFSGGISWQSSSNPLSKRGFANRNNCMTYSKLSASAATAIKSLRGYPNLAPQGRSASSKK